MCLLQSVKAAKLQTSEFAENRKIVTSTLSEAKMFAANGFQDVSILKLSLFFDMESSIFPTRLSLCESVVGA